MEYGICALLPFTTWSVSFAAMFYAEAEVPELGFGSPIGLLIGRPV